MKEIVCPSCEAPVEKWRAKAMIGLKCQKCKAIIELVAITENDKLFLEKVRRNRMIHSMLMFTLLLGNAFISRWNETYYHIFVPICILVVITSVLILESRFSKRIYELIENEQVVLKVKNR